MKIRSIETFKLNLPFRFSFGHALAARSQSSNLIVKITLDNGVCGWGESVPREYVTGETVDEAESRVLLNYAPLIMDCPLDNPADALKFLSSCFDELGLRKKAQGASWCAAELAILDAISRLHAQKLCDLLGGARQQRVRYGGTVPFGKKRALQLLLYFFKLFGYETVKLKVGDPDLAVDVERLRLARKVLGEKVRIRVDANCAWTLDQALRAQEAFLPYRVSSFEQPLPAADLDGLAKLSAAIEEPLVLDESLCTIEQAQDLAAAKVCKAFNIRISKAGGLLASNEICRIARSYGLELHLGAQVGESGILSAAGRHFALANEAFENYEGSANFFLLQKDICKENLNVGPGGFGSLKYSGKTPGLGLTVIESRIFSMTDCPGSSPEKVGSF